MFSCNKVTKTRWIFCFLTFQVLRCSLPLSFKACNSLPYINNIFTPYRSHISNVNYQSQECSVAIKWRKHGLLAFQVQRRPLRPYLKHAASLKLQPSPAKGKKQPALFSRIPFSFGNSRTAFCRARLLSLCIVSANVAWLLWLRPVVFPRLRRLDPASHTQIGVQFATEGDTPFRRAEEEDRIQDLEVRQGTRERMPGNREKPTEMRPGFRDASRESVNKL